MNLRLYEEVDYWKSDDWPFGTDRETMARLNEVAGPDLHYSVASYDGDLYVDLYREHIVPAPFDTDDVGGADGQLALLAMMGRFGGDAEKVAEYLRGLGDDDEEEEVEEP